MARVLIAGANDVDLHAYQALFSNHKYTVDTAKRASECFAKLARSAPEALILDVDIPGGGADGVLALMRADAQLRRIPVLLTASAATRDELARLVSPPVLLALTKPISLAVLLQTVDDATTILRQIPWSETVESGLTPNIADKHQEHSTVRARHMTRGQADRHNLRGGNRGAASFS